MRNSKGEKYVWYLSRTGDCVDVVAVGTIDEAQAFCERERLSSKGYYNLNLDDLDSPFILKL